VLFVKMHVSDGGGGILSERAERVFVDDYVYKTSRAHHRAFILIDFITRSEAPLENSNLCVRERRKAPCT
jgi:hypothetical protein